MTTHATAQSGALPGNARQTDSYVIAALNGKGGSGKTATIMQLAAHTSAAHGRALVADTDPQANAYDLTQAMSDPGYDVIHELDPKQLTRISQVRDYDSIYVDTPGTLDHAGGVLDEVLERATFVLIPYDHVPESVMPTVRTAKRVAAAGVPYAVVLTKVDPRLIGPDGAGFVQDAWDLLDRQGIRHFRTVIRLYRAWPNSLQAGVPITRWNERYAPKLREDIAALHTELLIDLGRRNLGGAS